MPPTAAHPPAATRPGMEAAAHGVATLLLLAFALAASGSGSLLELLGLLLLLLLEGNVLL